MRSRTWRRDKRPTQANRARPELRRSAQQGCSSLGEIPPQAATTEVILPHAQRAVDEGMAPAAVADLVADAITANRFWVFTDPRATQIAVDRWQRIAEGRNTATASRCPAVSPGRPGLLLGDELRHRPLGGGEDLFFGVEVGQGAVPSRRAGARAACRLTETCCSRSSCGSCPYLPALGAAISKAELTQSRLVYLAP